MQKFLLPAFILFGLSAKAQVPEDALRFSFNPQSGTARNLAIGGAMGSLGGDLNATFVNPAGLGFFRTGEFILTPSVLLLNNKATFRGTNAAQNDLSKFNIGTSGFVLGYENPNKPGTSNAISIAVTQTANFNNVIQYKGLNNYSSFSEQFAEEFATLSSKGYTIDDLLNQNSWSPYTVAPALFTYLVDTINISDDETLIKAAPEYVLEEGGALMQEMNKTTKGGVTELAIAFAHNQDSKWFVGGSIGIPITNYGSYTNFKEYDTSSNTNNNFKAFEFIDDFTTKGIGINAKLGVIYRPQDYIRLGLAIHTPTFNAMTDTRVTRLITQLENPENGFDVSSTEFTNGQAGQSKYFQSTPWKFIGSASYVFREAENVNNQKGFLTADVEYIDHRNSNFSSDNSQENFEEDDNGMYSYRQLNSTIREQYKGAFNFRVGGELKFNIIMARLGFAYYGNPYKDPATKASRTIASGGLGYRNKGMFLDLTYAHAFTTDVNFPYRLQDKDNTFATLKQQRGNVVATIGFKF